MAHSATPYQTVRGYTDYGTGGLHAEVSSITVKAQIYLVTLTLDSENVVT